MRKKIEQLSRGIFNYKTPSIILSEEKIEITLETGKNYQGSFTIKNDENTTMKGLIYSSNNLLTFLDVKFLGVENEIYYKIHGLDLNAGETLDMEIQIISNLGEIIVPVHATIEASYCITSLGKIKDLFHFTNLAKDDWAEALRLFKSDEFERVFFQQDPKNLILYQSLIKSTTTSRAMEEFLIAVHKKVPVNIKLDKMDFEYHMEQESFMDKILITKDNWGFQEIKVSTEDPFISIEHKVIWSENFIGNTYNLEYVVNPKFMRDGCNYGRIYIETSQQTLVVYITCHCVKDTRVRDEHHLSRRRYEIGLTKAYLRFRGGITKVDQYIQEAEKMLRILSTTTKDIRYDMLLTHLYIISNREEKANQMLETFKDYEKEWKEQSGFEYCAYLYLNALYQKEESIIDKAVKEITYFYENGHSDWRIQWFLLYLDKKYEENTQLKLKAIKDRVEEGLHSPILYYEALAIYNKQPSLLRELDAFELQIMNYGIRNDMITEETAVQFTYLTTREKKFKGILYKNLVTLYEKYHTKDLLFAICSILIKGQLTTTESFPWYHLGAEAGLKITGLSENYIYSIDETTNITLPQPILLYFIYNSNLSDHKKAFLYAYIIKNKELIPSIYRTYLKQMENFCLKQISLHNINPNLAILYDEILTKDIITESIANDLPFIMFQHDIKCLNTNMKGVCVIHKELDSQVYVPFINGEAQINIYTENAIILLMDYKDNRYIATIEYVLNRLMNDEKYLDYCYLHHQDNPMFLLALSEKVENYQKSNDNAVKIQEKILRLPQLRHDYYKKYLLLLIQHYYDNMEGELLEATLLSVDLQYLSQQERIKVIEYAIIRELYSRSLLVLAEYGYNGVSLKRLLKLCSKIISNGNVEEYKDALLVISYHVFETGRYDEPILKYLVEHYNGTTKNMYLLWKAAKETSMNTVLLEERLLVQMLFSESYIEDVFAVFNSYYEEGNNKKLIKAFLSFYAYRYLVHDRVVWTDLFEILQKELVFEENNVGMLAVLKYFSEKGHLSTEELKFTDYQIHEYLKKGFILPFFQDFGDRINLPHYIRDKYYVTYKTDPKMKVQIHYRLEGDEDFKIETMHNVYLGIHVKEFVIFYNEELQYYITEEEGEYRNITESFNVKLDNQMEKEEEDTRYNTINLMLMAREMKDDKTLIEIMENLVATNYIVDSIFTQR